MMLAGRGRFGVRRLGRRRVWLGCWLLVFEGWCLGFGRRRDVKGGGDWYGSGLRWLELGSFSLCRWVGCFGWELVMQLRRFKILIMGDCVLLANNLLLRAWLNP
jgi:hypothetical protein